MVKKNAIIIPSFNRPERLARCLDAACSQDADDYEIIVVDDGSRVPLSEICASFGDKVRYIRQQNLGPAAARNNGVKLSSARFLAFTDDDCCPRPDWLSTLITAHGGDDSCLVGGLVVNGLADNSYASASQALCDFLYDYFEASSGKIPFFTSNNLGISRSGFDLMGGFDESFGRAASEDRDFCCRWREAGGRLVYSHVSIVDHYHDMRINGFLRQHFHYGAGARHFRYLIKKRGVSKPKLEPMSFYFRLIFWPFKFRGSKRLRQAFLLALSQTATLAGYVSAFFKANGSNGIGRSHVS